MYIHITRLMPHHGMGIVRNAYHWNAKKNVAGLGENE